jgi:hypothetical protein
VIVGEIKGYTSYVIANLIMPEIGFRWQGGYGVFSVSRRDIPGLLKYVNNQKEHHQQKSLIDDWELPQDRTRL